MDLSHIPNLIISILSILGSAFSSFSEISLFVVDKVKLHKIIVKDRKNGRFLKKLLEKHRETLITILFMNVFFNTLFAISVSSLLLSLNVILSTVIISLLITFFGEILPKIGGYSIAENMVLFVSRVVYFLNFVGKPVFRFVDKSIIYPLMRKDSYYSKLERAEFIEIVKRNIKNDKIRSIVDVLALDAKDIMVPISNISSISIDAKDIRRSFEKIVTFSRYIFVYEETITNIVGVVKIEKLLSLIDKPSLLFKYFEPVNFAPETKKIYDLVTEMKSKNLEVSVVVDEYGNIIGFITSDVIFNYIFKVGVSKIIEVSQEKFLVDGDTLLKEFNEFFQMDLDSKFYNTISGFIIEKLGKIPNKGEILKLPNGMVIEIGDVKNGKIENIVIKLNSKL